MGRLFACCVMCLLAVVQGASGAEPDKAAYIRDLMVRFELAPDPAVCGDRPFCSSLLRDFPLQQGIEHLQPNRRHAGPLSVTGALSEQCPAVVLFDPGRGSRTRDMPRRNAEIYVMGPADRPSAWVATYFEMLPTRRIHERAMPNEAWIGRYDMFDPASCRTLFSDSKGIRQPAANAERAPNHGLFRYRGSILFFAVEEMPQTAPSPVTVDVFEISDDPQKTTRFGKPSRMIVQYRRKAPD
jgi:hypothetical protein